MRAPGVWQHYDNLCVSADLLSKNRTIKNDIRDVGSTADFLTADVLMLLTFVVIIFDILKAPVFSCPEQLNR